MGFDLNLGERILKLRKACGLSQEQLAEMVGVSRQAISKWETDQSTPEIEKILMLSKVFSVSADELLGNEATAETAALKTPQLTEVLRTNTKRRRFTIGWLTVVIGFVLLIVEYFSLFIIQFNAMKLELEHAAGTGYFADPMMYASVAPMPLIFGLTVGVIVLGAVLVAVSFCGRKQCEAGKLKTLA